MPVRVRAVGYPKLSVRVPELSYPKLCTVYEYLGRVPTLVHVLATLALWMLSGL